MTGFNAPCLNCDNRTISCHDDCSEYRNYAMACERLREAKAAENSANSIDYDRWNWRRNYLKNRGGK